MRVTGEGHGAAYDVGERTPVLRVQHVTQRGDRADRLLVRRAERRAPAIQRRAQQRRRRAELALLTEHLAEARAEGEGARVVLAERGAPPFQRLLVQRHLRNQKQSDAIRRNQRQSEASQKQSEVIKSNKKHSQPPCREALARARARSARRVRSSACKRGGVGGKGKARARSVYRGGLTARSTSPAW